jgi:3-oxoacyl-[acyl-carrier-protein] synthase-1
VIPGEGAACVLVVDPRRKGTPPVVADILGVGLDTEPDTVLGTKTSIGTGLLAAVRKAVAAAGSSEATIELRVSDVNAERYRGLESMLAEARFYRQRRSQLPVVYPAMSVGDLGAASGVLLLIVSASRRASRRAASRCARARPSKVCAELACSPLRGRVPRTRRPCSPCAVR